MDFNQVLFKDKTFSSLLEDIYKNATRKEKQIKALIDTNNDGHISAQEEEKALEILKRADKQRKKKIQGEFLSHLTATSTLF